jgi:pyridoxal phosphate enzyme (YggS family)
MSIAGNVARVRERIAAACVRAGRSPNDVRLMAVSKTHPASAVREAFAAGVTLFGENRVQEFGEKHAELANIAAEFHLIGHLQSNKAAKAAELFSAVDSVDSWKLAERLNGAAEKLGKTLAILFEVNVGGEAAKSGFAPDSEELRALLARANELPHLQVRGLMTIPPHTEDPNGARPYFRTLRELRDHLAKQFPQPNLNELSMGMSHDYEIAIEEGSTCVRVGTAIFGERPPR